MPSLRYRWFVDTGVGLCWVGVTRVFLLCLLIWGMRGGACREESGGGAGWGIVEGAIGCLSVVVIGACVRLSKPPWLFVVVGTRGRSSIVVMGPH